MHILHLPFLFGDDQDWCSVGRRARPNKSWSWDVFNRTLQLVLLRRGQFGGFDTDPTFITCSMYFLEGKSLWKLLRGTAFLNS